MKALNRYCDPSRAYHNWDHINHMLKLKLSIVHELCNPRATLLALLFHDAVYDPRRSDNEARSAQLMQQEVPEAGADHLLHATQLILFTQHHQIYAGAPEQVRHDATYFLDLDLAILGSSPDVFTEYCEKIRQEYHFVPESEYRVGRAGILQKFLDRPRLYFTKWGHDLYEASARANLAKEIRRLGA